METKVKEVLKSKGGEVWSVNAQATAYEALELMAEKNIGALVVLENGKPIGVFSERDYVRKVIRPGMSSSDTPVSRLMTAEVIAVQPDTTIRECMGLYTHKRIRHLPVIDDGEVVGMVSIGDVVKTLIADLEFTVHDLENYITGGGYGARV
jgi:CBS domain-containing protein